MIAELVEDMIMAAACVLMCSDYDARLPFAVQRAAYNVIGSWERRRS